MACPSLRFNLEIFAFSRYNNQHAHTRVVVVIIILLWQCIDRNPATIIGTTTFLPSFVLTPSFDFTDNSNHGSNKVCLHDDLSSPCRPMLSFVGGIRVGLFGRTDAHVH